MVYVAVRLCVVLVHGFRLDCITAANSTTKTMTMIRLSIALVLSLGLSSVMGFTVPQVTMSTTTTSTTSLAMSQQAEYGQSLEYPETYVKCGKCQSVYAIQEKDLGEKGRGRRLSCSVCQHSWFQSKDRLMTRNQNFEMIPLPDTDKERIELNMKEGKNPGFTGAAKLYVGNIAFECHELDLVDVFSDVGVVGDVSLVRDNEGKIRGFGFITMRNKADAEKAIDELDGVEIRGRKLTVRESNN